MLTFSRTRIKSSKGFGVLSSRFFASRKNDLALKKSYQVLGVSEDCEDEKLRLAFVHLAKKFHPDSGNTEADSIRFAEIEKAYRDIRRFRNTEADNQEKIEGFDIKHTAPQHRHYLTHNTGTGTPSERQRRNAVERAQKAAERVMDHKIQKLQVTDEKSLIEIDKSRAEDIKTRFGMDRLVEDLIQEAMSRGEFNDLPGTGKPLKDDVSMQNPHIDFITYKLNEVLIKNGFTPEWIRLSKEIKEETEELEKKLTDARNKLNESLDINSEKLWNLTLENLRETEQNINNKIEKYNFLVPIIQKQQFKINLQNIAETILSKPSDLKIKEKKYTENSKSSSKPDYHLFKTLFSIFSK